MGRTEALRRISGLVPFGPEDAEAMGFNRGFARVTRGDGK